MQYEIELIGGTLELRFRELGGKVQVVLVPLTAGIPMLLKAVSILCNENADVVRSFDEFPELVKAIQKVQ